MKRAAGILFVSPKGTALFLKRAASSVHFPLAWCFPGGGVEGDETAEEAAKREAAEEVGKLPKGERMLHTRSQSTAADGKALGVGLPPTLVSPPSVPPQAEQAAAPPPDLPPVPASAVAYDQVDFTTFVQQVDEEFTPVLNDEHVGWCWAPVDNPPEPLHPGCRIALDRISMNELGVARAIADGRLTSPQQYENMWLFAIRITGTEVAYRNALDEYVFRRPENYLNDEFLARCNGLSVIYKQRSGKEAGYHPKDALLNSKEFAERVVGSIFLPYIAGNEVWGIAKIYDAACARDMEEKQLSTSPSVFFRQVSVNSKLELKNGSTLLIEGNPSLLDHVCICEQGVWDKVGVVRPGEETAGVRSEARGDSAMAGEDEKKMDAEDHDEKKADADAGTQPDKLLSHIADSIAAVGDSLEHAHKRMDAIEEGMKEDSKRKDARRGDDDKDEDEKRGDDDEDPDDPKRLAADAKKRKDARKKDAEDDPEDKKADKAKKDEDEKEGEKKSDAKADSVDLSALVKQVEDLSARTPRLVGDTDYYALTDAQQRADEVYSLFGKMAPRPLAGDTPALYERRVVKELKQHSKTWKAIDPQSAAFADDASFAVIRDQVYAEAAEAGKRPDSVETGTLRPVRRRTAGGHEVIEYFGEPRSWMDQHAGAVRKFAEGRWKHS
jgi:8-oxo-dGTP pyrophosphatase MutT (NUDIX family)